MSAPFRHFTKYRGTVKEPLEVPLGLLTSIVGEEESYKSSIGIGIRLALTGKFADIGPHPSDLIHLAADKGQGISAGVYGPDGDVEWRLLVDPNTGKAKTPAPPHFNLNVTLSEDDKYRILPSDSVRDLLKNAKGEKKLREAMLKRWGGSAKDLQDPILLEDEMKLWKDAVAAIRKGLSEDTADALLSELTEHFRGASRRLNAELSTARSDVDMKRRALTSQSAGGELLEQHKKELEKAKAWDSASGLFDERDELQDSLDRVERELSELGEIMSKENAEFSQKETEALVHKDDSERLVVLKKAEVDDVRFSLGSAKTNVKVYNSYLLREKTKCPFCVHNFMDSKPIVTRAQEFARRAAVRNEELESLTNQLAELEKSLKTAEAFLTVLRLAHARETGANDASYKRLAARKKELETSLNNLNIRLAGAPTRYFGEPSHALQQKIDAVEAVKAMKLSLASEEVKIREKERTYSTLKKLEKEATQLQTTVMESISSRISDEVSSCMSGRRTARLDPRTCDWYITDPDGIPRIFGAASGTQKTSLKLGFLAAWTRGSPIRIPILDDEDVVGLSAKGIRDFYSALEASVECGDFTQVIFINNRPELVPENGKWLKIVRSRILTTPEQVSEAVVEAITTGAMASVIDEI